MANVSIGGYKVGDSIGAGQVIHPSQKGQNWFEKRVTVDTNNNGKADKGDQVVLVAYKKPISRTMLPEFQDIKADNPTVRKFHRLEVTRDIGKGVAGVGVGVAMCTVATNGIKLGVIGMTGVLIGGTVALIAGGALRHKENGMLRGHLNQQIPAFVPAK
jgi:hypothetical protein